MSGAAKVTIQEWDYSTRVPSFPGLYGAIVLPAKKGVPNYPVLMTSETQLLQYYTPDETVRVGYDLSYYDALAFLSKTNKLWVVRAAENPLYGGAYLTQDKPVTEFAAAVTVGLSAFTLRQTTEEQIATAEAAWAALTTGDKVRLEPEQTSGKLPSPLGTGADYYVIKFDEDKKQLQVATSYENAYNGDFTTLEDAGSGSVKFVLQASAKNGELEYGLSDPDTYQLDSSDGKLTGMSSTFTLDVNDNAFNVTLAFYETCQNYDAVKLTAGSSGSGAFPEVAVGSPLDAKTTYYVIKQEDEENGSYKVKLARRLEDAQADKSIDLLTTGDPGMKIALSGKKDTSDATLDPATDTFTVDAEFYSLAERNDKVKITVSGGGSLPDVETGSPITSSTEYFVIKGVSNKIQVSTTANGTAINFSDSGSGTLTLVLTNKTVSSTTTVDLTDDIITVSETFYEYVQTGNAVQVSSAGTLPSGLTAGTTYYAYKPTTGSANKIKVCRTAAEAQLGIGIDILDTGEGEHTIKDVHNTELTGLDRKCMLVYNSTPCEEEVYIQTLHYPYGDSSTWTEDQRTTARTVGEPGCFILYVYKKNSNGEYYLAESHTLSRDPSYKNGYGTNLYCEEAIKSSKYVRIKDNTAVDPSILPTDQGQMLKLTKGSNGTTVMDSTMVKALDSLKSRRNINLTVVMDGGWATPAYAKAIIELCEGRQDCVGLLSTPVSAELSTDYLNELKKYRNETLNANTSYAALYTPHVKISDKYNDREIYVSPTGYVAGCISDNEQNYEIWFAPAGPKYGVLNVLDVARRFSEGELDDLYDTGINPIDYYEGRGIRIWGQKTLQSTASALDRLNVRLMLIVIEPAIAEFLEDFLFDINDDVTRRLVEEGIKSYMEGIKSRRGVYDYMVKCDAENNTDEVIDANEMEVWLYVQPTKTAEFIKFKVMITKTGASFEAVTS